MANDLAAAQVELERLAPPDGIDREQHWIESAAAPGLLGPDVPAQRWAIAEHLLGRWLEWDSWVGRWSRYFGQDQEDLPVSWQSLRDRWSEETPRLLNDAELRIAILREYHVGEAQADSHQSRQGVEDAVRGVFHQVVQKDRLYRFDQRTAAAVRQVDPFEGPWRRDMLALERSVESLSAMERNRLYRLIMTYRHSMLLVSWLDSGWLSRFAREVWEVPDMHDRVWMEEVVSKLVEGMSTESTQLQDLSQLVVRRIVKRIADAVNELGYDAFLADVQSADFRPGPETALGDEDINVIPGGFTGTCCPVLIALSKGRSGRATLSFENIMRRVKTHLIDCADVTRAVIFLADSWDSREFADKYFDELAAHHRRGVRFAFLQVGMPRTMLAPVAVDLGRPDYANMLAAKRRELVLA